jgi:dTDP-4-dehydrorhamnose 3,5-epimerase
MNIFNLHLRGLCLLEPKVHHDSRGWFMETWNRKEMEDAGLVSDFVQANHSKSGKGVIRGMHFQVPPLAQTKLIRCTRGKIWDVVVDIRYGSSTYGDWESVYLNGDDFKLLYVPEGFAHGFCVLSDVAELQYMCSNPYSPEHAKGVLWNDLDLGILWPTPVPELSKADKQWPMIKDLPGYFV